jgi:hypothetical protein
MFTKYPVKILVGDFSAKIGREDIFNPTIGKGSLYEISNDNGVRVKVATSKHLTVKSKMLTPHDIPNFTWASPDGKTENQIDYIF